MSPTRDLLSPNTTHFGTATAYTKMAKSTATANVKKRREGTGTKTTAAETKSIATETPMKTSTLKTAGKGTTVKGKKTQTKPKKTVGTKKKGVGSQQGEAGAEDSTLQNPLDGWNEKLPAICRNLEYIRGLLNATDAWMDEWKNLGKVQQIQPERQAEMALFLCEDGQFFEQAAKELRDMEEARKSEERKKCKEELINGFRQS